jgi:hypothetical protein
MLAFELGDFLPYWVNMYHHTYFNIIRYFAANFAEVTPNLYSNPRNQQTCQQVFTSYSPDRLLKSIVVWLFGGVGSIGHLKVLNFIWETHCFRSICGLI